MNPRWYQSEAVKATIDYFHGNNGNPLIVLPTGSGKSVVIAYMIKKLLTDWPTLRILKLTHVKELIEQNFEKLMSMCSWIDAGIYSASLRRRDILNQVIFAGIQSVHKKADLLGKFDLVIIDEAHLINARNDGMYRKMIDDIKKINPNAACIGLTATAFRTSTGDITKGNNALFSDIIYELPIKTLLDEGHLCNVVTKKTDMEYDFSEVKIIADEYSSKGVDGVVDKTDVIEATVSEMIKLGTDRKSWLVFCGGVNHSHHVADVLRSRGVSTGTVTGKTNNADRERILSDYKNGKIKALTNANVLTTGFDAPHTDLIALLRPTMSPGLYMQMIGRGMRPAKEKRDCLCLDFAGNIMHHGPIDQIRPWVPSMRKKKKQLDVPVKACKSCGTYNPIQVRKCSECGTEFPVESKIKPTASELEVISVNREKSEPKWYEIKNVEFHLHSKQGGKESVRVSYQTESLKDPINEWICFGHSGFARAQAILWWQRTTGHYTGCPHDAKSFFAFTDKVKKPTRIQAKKDGNYMRVVNYEF